MNEQLYIKPIERGIYQVWRSTDSKSLQLVDIIDTVELIDLSDNNIVEWIENTETFD